MYTQIGYFTGSEQKVRLGEQGNIIWLMELYDPEEMEAEPINGEHFLTQWQEAIKNAVYLSEPKGILNKAHKLMRDTLYIEMLEKNEKIPRFSITIVRINNQSVDYIHTGQNGLYIETAKHEIELVTEKPISPTQYDLVSSFAKPRVLKEEALKAGVGYAKKTTYTNVCIGNHKYGSYPVKLLLMTSGLAKTLSYMTDWTSYGELSQQLSQHGGEIIHHLIREAQEDEELQTIYPNIEKAPLDYIYIEK